MIILDENIIAPEQERLRAWRIHFRRIGVDVGRFGMKDREEIIPLLYTLSWPTLFTRDRGFYRALFLHSRYCLVYLEVGTDETATYIRRCLRHRAFRARAQRMGKIVRVYHNGVSYWQLHRVEEHPLSW